MAASAEVRANAEKLFQGRKARAAVFRTANQPLEIEQLEVAEPGRGEVLIRMAASGVCHSDYHVLVGEWETPTPLVLGHEGAGFVEALGDGVEGVGVGDKVVLSWSPNCGTCEWCVAGRPQLCVLAEGTTYRSVMFDGTTRLRSSAGEPVHAYCTLGTFSEFTVVPESAVVPVETDGPIEHAALVGCAVATGFGAVVNTAKVPVGASVAIFGCGGVGLSVVQGAAVAAASPIIAVDVRADALQLAERLGATHTVDATKVDPVQQVMELTGGRGVDFAFEAIGIPRTIEQAVSVIATGSTAVVVGQTPDGSRISVDPFRISDRELRIIGSNYGSCRPRTDFPRIIRLAERGVIDLDAVITETIGLEGINDAFDAMGRGDGARRVILYA